MKNDDFSDEKIVVYDKNDSSDDDDDDDDDSGDERDTDGRMDGQSLF